MAIHSSILAWRTPWAEEPGGSYSSRVSHFVVSASLSATSDQLGFRVRILEDDGRKWNVSQYLFLGTEEPSEKFHSNPHHLNTMKGKRQTSRAIFYSVKASVKMYLSGVAPQRLGGGLAALSWCQEGSKGRDAPQGPAAHAAHPLRAGCPFLSSGLAALVS